MYRFECERFCFVSARSRYHWLAACWIESSRGEKDKQRERFLPVENNQQHELDAQGQDVIDYWFASIVRSLSHSKDNEEMKLMDKVPLLSQ